MTNELKTLITIGLITVGLFVGAIWWMSQGQNSATQVADLTLLTRTDSHQVGSASAQVTLVEFGDFQCPSCGAVHPSVKTLLTQYPTQLKFVFRNFPLSMHPYAPIAAEAAEAAGAQGKYWEMHDWLYEHQADWSTASKPEDVFATEAQVLNLNVDQFKKALADHTFAKIVQQDTADGNGLSVDATPTFYVNGKKLTGSFSDLQNQIDAIIKATPTRN